MLSARRSALGAATLLVGRRVRPSSASAAVPGLELVAGAVNEPATGLSLQCPAGKEVIGVGGFVGDGDSGQVKLITLWPSSFTSAAVDTSTDQDGFAGFWSVGATATCADPLPGREVRRTIIPHAPPTRARRPTAGPAARRASRSSAWPRGSPASAVRSR